MNEWLRATLERLIAPEPLTTDLSENRSPAYALSHRGQKLLASDIAGGQRLLDSYTLAMRHCGIQEGDRRQAYSRLAALTEGLHKESAAVGGIVMLRVALPIFHEAYDDGMAAWSMTIEIETETERT